MLLNNYTIFNSSPGRAIGGFTNIYSNYKPSSWQSSFDTDTDTTNNQFKRASYPHATTPPYSWLLAPLTAVAEMSATTSVNGIGTILFPLQAIKSMASTDLNGVGTLVGSMSVKIQMASLLTGVGALTANMSARIAMASTLAGAGSLTGSMTLKVSMGSLMNGIGALTANLKGTAKLECSIYVNSGTATINELVDGVWESLLASHNTSGTMGEVMNNMGAVADPWSTALPGAYGAGTAGEILGTLNSSGIANAVWDELKAGHTTADTYGKIVQDLETLIKQVKSLTAAQL